MTCVKSRTNGTSRLLHPCRSATTQNRATEEPPSRDRNEVHGSDAPLAEHEVDNPDPLYDAVGAARYLGLVGVHKHPAQAVRALCRKRRLRSTMVGGRIMIRRSWLEEYLGRSVREPVA